MAISPSIGSSLTLTKLKPSQSEDKPVFKLVMLVIFVEDEELMCLKEAMLLLVTILEFVGLFLLLLGLLPLIKLLL